MLQNIGISPTAYLPKPARIAGLEASRLAQQKEEGAAAPARDTAASMLRKLPPAPQTRGMPNLRMGPPPAATPSAAPNLMYPTLFPNDPISQMLLQRQQQMAPSQ